MMEMVVKGERWMRRIITITHSPEVISLIDTLLNAGSSQQLLFLRTTHGSQLAPSRQRVVEAHPTGGQAVTDGQASA